MRTLADYFGKSFGMISLFFFSCQVIFR